MNVAMLLRTGTRRALLAGCIAFVVLAVASCSGAPSEASYQIRWQYFWNALVSPDGAILNGLVLTVVLSVTAQALGVILGIFAALGKMARFWPFRVASGVYIWIFRGTPLLVQLALIFYGFPSAGIFRWPGIEIGPLLILPEVLAGALILGINEGAYMAEIVRAGILAIDPGQQEAAKSLGMTYGQTMQRVVLPQAARVIIPPLGNEFNNMLKTTSLLSVLSVFELFNTFKIKAGQTYATFEFLLACAVWFLLLTTIWGFVQAWIERKFAKGTTQSSTGSPGLIERLFGRGKPSQDDIKVLGGH
jgi:polar amino acid transport system permease protein